MLATEASTAAIGIQIAELVAGELEDAVGRQEFGVIVQDVAPLDLGALANLAANPKFTRKQQLRTAMVGADAIVQAALERHTSLAGLLSAREETAVEWRNHR